MKEDILVKHWMTAPVYVIHASTPVADAYNIMMQRGIRRLPVRGSSQLGGTPTGVQWLPVAPNETFNPLNRGKELSDVDRQRIRWRALPEMTTFGYAPDEFTGPGTFRAIYFQSQSTATRVIRGARLALRDLRDAQTRRLRRRRRRPRPLP